MYFSTSSLWLSLFYEMLFFPFFLGYFWALICIDCAQARVLLLLFLTSKRPRARHTNTQIPHTSSHVRSVGRSVVWSHRLLLHPYTYQFFSLSPNDDAFVLAPYCCRFVGVLWYWLGLCQYSLPLGLLFFLSLSPWWSIPDEHHISQRVFSPLYLYNQPTNQPTKRSPSGSSSSSTLMHIRHSLLYVALFSSTHHSTFWYTILVVLILSLSHNTEILFSPLGLVVVGR